MSSSKKQKMEPAAATTSSSSSSSASAEEKKLVPLVPLNWAAPKEGRERPKGLKAVAAVSPLTKAVVGSDGSVQGYTWETPDLRVISMFAQKGGVGKTTMTNMVGWELASRGRRVLLVDADPQCNLSESLIPNFEDHLAAAAEKTADEMNEQPIIANSVWGLLAPYRIGDLLNGMTAVECINIQPDRFQANGGALLILPGSPSLITLESTLAMEFQAACNLQASCNNPGALVYGIRATAWWYGVDTVIIDMGPSGSLLNMLLVFSSNDLIIPATPSTFMVQVLRRGAKGLFAEWRKFYDPHRTMINDETRLTTTFKLPKLNLNVLGVIVNQYRPHNGNFSTAVHMMVVCLQEALVVDFFPQMMAPPLLITHSPNAFSDQPDQAVANLDALGPLSQYLRVAPHAIPDDRVMYWDENTNRWKPYGGQRHVDMVEKRDRLASSIRNVVTRLFPGIPVPAAQPAAAAAAPPAAAAVAPPAAPAAASPAAAAAPDPTAAARGQPSDGSDNTDPA